MLFFINKRREQIIITESANICYRGQSKFINTNIGAFYGARTIAQADNCAGNNFHGWTPVYFQSEFV